ncbi:MAG: ABC transporter permease [Thermodesulfobacteriota bacterium]
MKAKPRSPHWGQIKYTAVPHSSRFILSHFRLLLRATRNELRKRYSGSIFGLGLAVIYPLLMLALYTAVYLYIFQVRVSGLTQIQYVLNVFCGLIPLIMTMEAVSIGVASVSSNRSALNNTAFPLDLAPVMAVMISQTFMIVGSLVLLLGAVLTKTLSWTVVLFPAIWLMQVLALIGTNWIISLVNVVFRDLQSLITIFLLMIMIGSPIAYTPDMVPANLRLLIYLNPFAFFVTAYQQVVVFGRLPEWWNSLGVLVISLALFLIGGWFFARVKLALVDYV